MNESPIDRADIRPLYVQVKDYVRERIAAGDYRPGGMIGSERQFCRKLGVSHITVRQAFVELTREGVLVRRPGKGTFVAADSGVDASLRVGLITPESAPFQQSPFVVDLLSGIAPVVSARGGTVATYDESDARYVVDACERRLAGVIFLVPHVRDRMIPMLLREGVPLVVVGETDAAGAFSVDTDNEAVGRMAAAHLVEQGRRHCGFIGGPRHFTVTSARLRGFRKGLTAAGVSLTDSFTRFGPYAGETGSRCAPELAAQGADALFCADDMIALGAMSALLSEGLRVPEDVAVVGCNNSAFARHTYPPLTTVDTFAAQLGRASAEVLMKALNGGGAPRRTLVEAELVVRESSARNAEAAVV